MAFQVFVDRHRGSPVGADLRHLAHDEALDERAARFDVFHVHAIIPDLRIGHRHNLPGVGRIGQDLLIAGHRGVEDYFACSFAVSAPRQPAKSPSILKRQNRLFSHYISNTVEDRGSKIESSTPSSILDPRSSILDPRSSILDPRFSILDPHLLSLKKFSARFIHRRSKRYLYAGAVRTESTQFRIS